MKSYLLRRAWREWRHKEGWVSSLVLALIGYSVGLLVVTFVSDVAIGEISRFGPKFAGYWEKPNWSPFPLFWIVIAALVFHTWQAFDGAWRDIAKTSVLCGPNGKSATSKDGGKIQEKLGHYRPLMFAIAIMVAATLTFLETSDIQKIHQFCRVGDLSTLLATLDTPTQLQVAQRCGMHDQQSAERVCVEIDQPAFQARVNDPKMAKLSSEASPDKCMSVAAALSDDFEWDFTVAYLADGISRGSNASLNIAIYVQQILLGAIALLVLFQVCLQCIAFWFLNEWKSINPKGFKIRLNPFSKLNEFGLEAWNHALNNIYWVYCVALLVPIFSRAAQAGEHLDTGQVMLQFLVPILIAAPMLLSIIGRQQLQSDVWPRIREEDDEQLIKRYHEQRLWPLDRNWAAKLGIVISFALLAYLLGANLLTLIG